jgi:hypothetical protein
MVIHNPDVSYRVEWDTGSEPISLKNLPAQVQ